MIHGRILMTTDSSLSRHRARGATPFAFKPGPRRQSGHPTTSRRRMPPPATPARRIQAAGRPSRRRKVVRRRGNLLPSGLDAAPRPNVDGDGEPVGGFRLDERAGHDHIVVRDGACGERTHGSVARSCSRKGAVILSSQIRVRFHHRGSDPRRSAALRLAGAGRDSHRVSASQTDWSADHTVPTGPCVIASAGRAADK